VIGQNYVFSSYVVFHVRPQDLDFDDDDYDDEDEDDDAVRCLLPAAHVPSRVQLPLIVRNVTGATGGGRNSFAADI
jgi:hypothetical protein